MSLNYDVPDFNLVEGLKFAGGMACSISTSPAFILTLFYDSVAGVVVCA